VRDLFFKLSVVVLVYGQYVSDCDYIVGLVKMVLVVLVASGMIAGCRRVDWSYARLCFS
jgi:hypothetical protein